MLIPFLLLTASVVSATAPDYVVDLQGDTIPSQLAALTCTGLYNRDLSGSSVYTIMTEPFDSEWLLDVEGVENPSITSTDNFLSLCMSNKDIVRGYILYDYGTQKEVVPNLITLAAVTDSILLEASNPATAGATMTFDAVSAWAGYNGLTASYYMYENYVNNTSTLAFMNPGFDGNVDARNPPLTQDPNVKLTDFLVKEKVFNFYLNDACIRGTDEYEFVLMMTGSNPWPNPIPVYGYNDAYPVAGTIFEAETNCNPNHNMGQIASKDTNNFAYFSRKDAIAAPLPKNEEPKLSYNSSMTYVMFVIGDGDNVAYVKSTRRSWMQDRADKCAADPSYLGCFPLTWSMSPQLTHLAPDWLNWYYAYAQETTKDFFVLPPSGDLYAYPEEMPEDVLNGYVSSTERDCELLSTPGTVEWEWIFHWGKAFESYFPKYISNGIVQGLFTVNVPFNLPVATQWAPGMNYRIVRDDAGEGKVVAFKPREWRGDSCAGNYPLTRKECLTVEEMAKEVNEFWDEGTVTWIYVTSDGGGNLQMLYDLVENLDEHVLVVGPETLIDMAIQRGD